MFCIKQKKKAILLKRVQKGAGWLMENREKQDFCWENLPEQERMKYEIAEELGLLDRVREYGWKSLSAKETGKIGGMMTRRNRENKR